MDWRFGEPKTVGASSGYEPEGAWRSGVISKKRLVTKRGLQAICFAEFHASMKTTVTLSSRGVISLPAKVRTELGLEADDMLLLETTSEGILLRPAATLPVEIYDERRIREFDDEESALAAALPKSRKRRRR